jgi:two-component system alkaline phosphatase synthesis response regulator PhoP
MSEKKILLVDDAATILMIERIILGKSYVLVTATDGEEALAAAAREKPDLIILDIVMPKMDGFEVCRRIRSDDNTKSIPIIMVTTKGDSDNVGKAFQSGCNDYVTKPISSAELLSKVRLHLGE